MMGSNTGYLLKSFLLYTHAYTITFFYKPQVGFSINHLKNSETYLYMKTIRIGGKRGQVAQPNFPKFCYALSNAHMYTVARPASVTRLGSI